MGERRHRGRVAALILIALAVPAAAAAASPSLPHVAPGHRPGPDAAGGSSPAAEFLTVHGTTAELTDAASGKPLTPAPSTTVDVVRNQIGVRVPHAAWDPSTSKVRVEIGTGVWDAAANGYAQP